MSFGHESGPLLGGYQLLESGLRLRLRLARGSDRDSIMRLVDGYGSGAIDFETGSLVHFDPRKRCVICATALIDSSETLVGLGVIELDGAQRTAPSALIVDPRYPEVAEPLSQALVTRARGATRSRAA